jgi:cell division protein FtsL
MKEQAGLAAAGLLPGRAIDNSQVVREVDPRASRDILALLGLVAGLVGALGLYAWPALKLRQAGVEREQLSRARDRLREENRKLRLEKATYEDLRRIEAIAVRELGLRPPSPEQVVVVERPRPLVPGTREARGDGASPPLVKAP